MDGLVVVDKEAGWTSHDVVARCRGIFGQRRVGHAGTLDPDATGVLLVGLGRATRLMRYFSGLPKTYQGEVVLGSSTSTLDASGQVTGTWDMTGVTLTDARAAAAQLSGDILQVPPMVSALKVDGQRLHQLARQGIEVDRPPRPVRVYQFDLGWAGEPDSGVLAIEVTCSSGTYVRSLADDLGRLLGGGAHLRHLCRVAIGSFTLSGASLIGDLSDSDVLTPAEATRDFSCLRVGEEQAIQVSHGRPLAAEMAKADVGRATGEGPWAVLGPNGDLLAVYEADGDVLRPAVVLAAAD
ncbi:MAG: tRNA pseudouridine(55) synthase TruB [Acidimicrobiales bacterium]